jgi:hypothetical protein
MSFYRNGNDNHEIGTGSFEHKGIISAVKRADIISDRILHIILRGHWYHIILLNAHSITYGKIDDVKNSFYEDMEYMFKEFLEYHMKILLDFSAKVGRKGIFRITIGNQSLHKISNDTGVVNFATSKSPLSKV